MKRADFHSLPTGSAEETPIPAAVSGRELQELLSPISSEEFVNSYFSHASLRVQGTPDKFDHIFSWEKLRNSLTRGQKIRDKRYNIMASFTRGEYSGSSRRMTEVSPNQVEELFQTGATICITNIHMTDPCLARWAQAIRTQLNFTGTVGVNCYISPDGSGLSTHYDKRVATTLQIAGKKRWKFSTEPAKAWPNHNAVYQEGNVEPIGVDHGNLPPDMEFREVELNPGDLLCLPAGVWHSAQAVGESLAINLYFQPRNFLDQLIPMLQHFALSDKNWRAGPPVTLEEVRGEMPKVVSAYIQERLDEFRKMALEVLGDSDALTESWLNSSAHYPYTGWQPSPKKSLRGFTSEQRLRVAKSSLRFVEFQDRLILPCDNGTLKFPATAASFLLRLSSESSSFTVHDVLTWQVQFDEPSQNKIVSYLQILIENGIVEVVD